MDKLQAGERVSGLQPVLSHGASDFSFLMSDFGESPASLGRASTELVNSVPGIESISIRPPMADVRVSREWRVQWILEGKLPGTALAQRKWELPRSLSKALTSLDTFEQSDWGQMGMAAIQMASLPVRNNADVVVVAFQLSTWEAPGVDFKDLSAGRFFSGQSNQAFRWLRSYFRAKSILKRAGSYLGVEPECRGEEEFGLTRALLQVPFCLSRTDEMHAFALLPAGFHHVQHAFTQLWVAKPLEDRSKIQETAYRFALLRRYVESCEAIGNAAGIALAALNTPGRG